MKFRKKPVVIDAVQWTVDNYQEIYDFCGDNVMKYVNSDELIIITKEDLYVINQGKISPIDEDKRPFKRMSINDRLFKHNEDIYYLRGSKLYKMVWKNCTRKTNGIKSPDRVEWLLYKTKSDIQLNDGTVLTRTKRKYSVNDDILKTIIRNSIVKQSLNSINLTSEIDINLTSNIVQLVRDPHKSEILYCLNKDGLVYKYNYEKNKITKLQGNGRKIVVCDEHLWLLSRHRCVKI